MISKDCLDLVDPNYVKYIVGCPPDFQVIEQQGLAAYNKTYEGLLDLMKRDELLYICNK